MLEKTIKAKNGDITTYIEDTYWVGCRTIQKSYFQQGKLSKTIILSMGDDYEFEGHLEDATIGEIRKTSRAEFDFCEDDILYRHLEKLLGQDSTFIIDDDETYEQNKKTMQIHKRDKTITIVFENQLQDNEVEDKFKVFIKNILYDNRSKIDYHQYDTKARLEQFFKDVRNEFFQLDKERQDEER